MVALATFARVYVSDLDQAIDALAASGVSDVRLRFGHTTGLQLTLVGNVLLLAGPPDLLAPFRSTDVTVIVENLEQAITTARRGGAHITRAPANQATGRNVTMTFPSGPVIEYVEWDQRTRLAVGV